MQTATNSETGERIVLIGDRWEPFEKSASNEKGEKAFLIRGQWMTIAGSEEPQSSGALGRLAQGMNVGLARAGTPLAGFAGGAKLGAMLGAPLGPGGALVASGIGAVAGGVGGYMLGEKIAEHAAPFTYGSLADLPQEMRPVARAGEAIGGSVPFAAVPYAVRGAISELPKIAQPIVRAARESPRAFAATEAGGAIGAAQGAAAAELLFPGSPTAGAVGEMAGGFVNPLAVATKGTTAAGHGIGMLSSSFRRSGREQAAAKAIQDAMIATGEQPQHVASILRQADLEGVSLTAGQKAESPTLLALEATIASKNPNFDLAMQNRMRENMAALRRLAGQLEATGEPSLLKEAARIRSRYFDSLIQGRVQAAQARMERAASVIGGDKARASVEATAILDDALSDARKAERALWEQVPRDQTLRPEGILSAHQRLRSQMLAEEPLPPAFIEQFVERIGKQGTVSSGEAMRFRSQMLERARESRGMKKWGEARIYEDMADGALADLAAMEGNAANEARMFSRSLNDIFSRTFASDALAVKGTGADRIVPEAVLQRAYGSGGLLANKRFTELEQAAQFSGKSMVQEQEEFLRAAATASVDPQTGRVNPRSLEGFLRANEQMLQRFPSLKRDLANASSAEQTFRNVTAAAEQARKAIQNRAVFSEVLRNESPANAIRNVLNSPAPQRSYQQLIKLARKGPTGAVEGLKSSTLDYAARQATATGGDFSFSRYREALTRPTSGKGPSLLKMMGQNGVMSPEEASRLHFILANAEKIEQGLARTAKMGEILATPDALYDLVVRMVGANIGGASVFAQSSGAPIVLAGAGSRMARNLFEKVPRTRVLDIVQEAAQNSKFMAALLEKPQSLPRQEQLHRQINGFLLQAGLIPKEGAGEETKR